VTPLTDSEILEIWKWFHPLKTKFDITIQQTRHSFLSINNVCIFLAVRKRLDANVFHQARNVGHSFLGDVRDRSESPLYFSTLRWFAESFLLSLTVQKLYSSKYAATRLIGS
jgi:hypothetical protein